jgi:hypothetical protein
MLLFKGLFMKEPKDAHTPDSEQPTRKRGGPSLVDALTPAQRAKRYRDRLRQLKESHQNKRDATEKSYLHMDCSKAVMYCSTPKISAFLKISRRRRQQIADLSGMLQMFIDAQMNKRSIPAGVFRNICQSFLKLTAEQPKHQR